MYWIATITDFNGWSASGCGTTQTIALDKLKEIVKQHVCENYGTHKLKETVEEIYEKLPVYMIRASRTDLPLNYPK